MIRTLSVTGASGLLPVAARGYQLLLGLAVLVVAANLALTTFGCRDGFARFDSVTAIALLIVGGLGLASAATSDGDWTRARGSVASAIVAGVLLGPPTLGLEFLCLVGALRLPRRHSSLLALGVVGGLLVGRLLPLVAQIGIPGAAFICR